MAKNIVFFLTDQQHFRTLQANGCPEAKTPNMDRLAREGRNFTRHFVANPVCGPSRGAIWTGQLPSRNGLYANGCRLREEAKTLPKVLNQAGWQTAHFGKMHLVPCLNRVDRHPNYGFTDFLCSEGDQFCLNCDYTNWLREVNPNAFQAYYYQMGIEGHMKAYTANLPEEYSHNSWVTRCGMDWLKEKRTDDAPFFLSLGYFDPHHAWNPCEPYASAFADAEVTPPRFEEGAIEKKPEHWQKNYQGMKGLTRDKDQITAIIRAYHAMCMHLDDCLGRLMTCLEEQGILNDTLIVFSSDHGEFLGNQGLLFKGPYLNDDILQVPMMVWDPSGQMEGGTDDSLTSALDFYATFAGMAGVSLSELPQQDGQRLWDENLNFHPDGQRDFVLSEWRNQPEGPMSDIVSVRTKTHRYTRYANQDAEEFYCYADDPGEMWNRANEPERDPEVKAELAALVEKQAPPIGNWPPPECWW